MGSRSSELGLLVVRGLGLAFARSRENGCSGREIQIHSINPRACTPIRNVEANLHVFLIFSDRKTHTFFFPFCFPHREEGELLYSV